MLSECIASTFLSAMHSLSCMGLFRHKQCITLNGDHPHSRIPVQGHSQHLQSSLYIYVCIDTIIASSALFTYCVQAHAHSLLHMLIKESLRWFVKQKLRCMVNKNYLLKGCNKGHNGEQHKEDSCSASASTPVVAFCANLCQSFLTVLHNL